MPPDARDAALLWDMLTHAREASELVRKETFDSFSENRVLRLAVQHLIQIVGEAANELSREFHAAHPEIPWIPIIKQRHIIVHDYGIIEDDKIWRVATIYIPELIRLVDPLMPSTPPDPHPESR